MLQTISAVTLIVCFWLLLVVVFVCLFLSLLFYSRPICHLYSLVEQTLNFDLNHFSQLWQNIINSENET